MLEIQELAGAHFGPIDLTVAAGELCFLAGPSGSGKTLTLRAIVDLDPHSGDVRLGADAQAQAYAQFQESPGQAYLREQAERSLVANSAATGGLAGGNVLKELQGQAVGLAAQDFQNQFDRRGTVADRGCL